MWAHLLLYLFLVQLLISPVLARIRMRGNSKARLSSSWNSNRGGMSSYSATDGSHGSTFRNALIGGALGAAGGILAVEAGKAIFHSRADPMHHVRSDNRRHCSMLLKEEVRNNSRPHQIIWTCHRNEVCCGQDCCSVISQENNGNDRILTIIVLGVIFVILTALFVGYCVYKLNREECIDIDDPARYKNYSYSDYPNDRDFRRNNNGFCNATYPSAAYPNGDYAEKNPNYYLPGYPPPYPPAYPTSYPLNSLTTETTQQTPSVHNQKEPQKENGETSSQSKS
ncbi:hypothetical protein NECAME_09700 [Necator americanus]|uniref:CX domain-containing protein n=1 Tax=Necator americanus TaxID=51031 RepID=W2TDI3_NECAM|nr:hypothetical protein NECAME_09700 [Necator americanus]ETN79654.1 hypothetical protein NECAME_09700 [Necator americanus]